MKRFLSIITIILLIMVFMVGCGNEGGSSNKELLGKYAGDAGSLEFLPEGKIKIDFNKDYTWMAMSSSRNHKIHTYNFLTDERKIVSYDKGEHLSFQENGKKSSFIYHPCKVEKDKIILHPDSVNETVFNKVSE